MAEKFPSRGEIFVVDDDPAVRDTLSMVLSTAGYQVICFADGAALLSVARTRTPACILLDVHIPGKSGLDLLKELHGEDYPAPIFMISGQGMARSTSSKSRSAAARSWRGSMKRSAPMSAGRRRVRRRGWPRYISRDANR